MQKRAGFTLLELSIVIAILSIMIGGIMAVVTQDVRRSKMAEVKMKMDAIEEALYAYGKANNRIPCPANGSLAITDANFGIEATKSTSGVGWCLGGAVQASWKSFATSIAGGVVPIRSLGLPDEYMFDPWGGRFTYIVDADRGACDSSSTGCGTPAKPAFILFNPQNSAGGVAGVIGIKDINGNARATSPNGAIAVLISHGPNGHGAFQLSGTRKNAGSNNLYEQNNCECSSSAAQYAAGSIVATFFQGPNTVTTGQSGDTSYAFDDIVRYYFRSDFVTNSDQATEPPNY